MKVTFLKSVSILALGLMIGTSGFAQDAETTLNLDEKAVTIDGTDYSVKDVKTFFDALPDQYKARGFEPLYPQIRQRFAEQTIVLKEARKENIEKGDEYTKALKSFKDYLLESIYVRNKIEEGMTDEMLQASYEKYKESLQPRDEVKARHILVKTKEEADSILADLEKGTDFSEIAKEKSTDVGTKDKGGDLGFFGKGQMVPAFEEAAFALEKGAYTKEPVQTDFGFHIIFADDKRTVEAEVQDFKTLEPTLRQQEGNRLRVEYFDKLAKDNNIVYHQSEAEKKAAEGDSNEEKTDEEAK